MGAAGGGIKRHKSSSQTNGHNASEEKEGEGKRDNGREEGDYAGNSHQPQTMSMYKDLRTWRQARAKSEKQPAFCVFGNKVLDAIVAAAPTSIASLQRVPGIGKARCGKYGAEILGIISASCLAQSFTPPTIGKRPAEHQLYSPRTPGHSIANGYAGNTIAATGYAGYAVLPHGVRLSVPGRRPVVAVAANTAAVSRGYSGGGVDSAVLGAPLGRPTEEQARVIDLVVRQRASVFITGAAGTGKSFVLKHIQRGTLCT